MTRILSLTNSQWSSETNVIKLCDHWITYPQGFSPLYLFPLKKKKKFLEIAVKFICLIFQRKQQSPIEVFLQDVFVNLKKPMTDLALWLELRSSLLLSRFSRAQLCATPQMAAHQAPPSLGFSRQEHWSGLPFPSPMHEGEKWKRSRSVVSDS